MGTKVDDAAEVQQVAGDPPVLVAVAQVGVELPGDVEFRALRKSTGCDRGE